MNKKHIRKIIFLIIISISIVIELLVAFYIYNFKIKKNISLLISSTPSLVMTDKNISLSSSIPNHTIRKIDSMNLTAESVLVKEITTDTNVYAKNANDQKYIASITKLITAITADSNFNNDRSIRTDAVSTSVGDSNVQLPNNAEFTINDLYYALLLPSSNEAAYAFANNLGYSNFIDKMNSVGGALGLKNSYFINPAGFDDHTQVNNKDVPNQSNAEDTAVFTKYFLNNSLFSKIVSTKNISVTSTAGQQINLKSTNDLLGVIPGVVGVKTGTENLAGQCLVIDYKKNDENYLIIIFHSQDRFGEAKKIIDRINSL